jgi:hypothetical protein
MRKIRRGEFRVLRSYPGKTKKAKDNALLYHNHVDRIRRR